MPRMALLLAACVVLFGQPAQVERFDVGGLPDRPTNFLEQQIFELLSSHRPGDLASAAAIQRKLGQYYQQSGDDARAAAAFRLAAAAAAEPVRQPEAKRAPDSPVRSALAGNYYGYEGRTLHTWDFHADGTFLHTWMISGSGTRVRNSERGVFRLQGDTLELKLGSSASGFSTPGIGADNTLIGGSAETATRIQRVKIRLDQTGKLVALDGIEVKPKSW